MKDYNQDSPGEKCQGLTVPLGAEAELEKLLEDGEAVTKNKEERVCCNLN